MAIHFDCPVCGDPHRSRLVIADRETFCSTKIQNHLERCPLTHEEVTLSHWDMFWMEEEIAAIRSWQKRSPRMPLVRVAESEPPVRRWRLMR